MPAEKMHADEVDTDAALVCRLLVAQFPEWAGLPIERFLESGTDNAIYRLGDQLAVRLPRRPGSTGQFEKEFEWLPRLAPHLPLAIPVPLVQGEPGEGYPLEWSVYGWLEGEVATNRPLADLGQAAIDLAGFISALRRIDPTDAPQPGSLRGEPLAIRDVWVRESIEALRDTIDVAAVTAAWETALRAPEWAAARVLIHADLDARNLLVQSGRLSAVIDFGSFGVGDPALDVMVAWKMLDADARRVFRAALEVDDATWARARGWALSQSLIALSYYTLDTYPVLVREARHWMAEVLSEGK